MINLIKIFELFTVLNLIALIHKKATVCWSDTCFEATAYKYNQLELSELTRHTQGRQHQQQWQLQHRPTVGNAHGRTQTTRGSFGLPSTQLSVLHLLNH